MLYVGDAEFGEDCGLRAGIEGGRGRDVVVVVVVVVVFFLGRGGGGGRGEGGKVMIEVRLGGLINSLSLSTRYRSYACVEKKKNQEAWYREYYYSYTPLSLFLFLVFVLGFFSSLVGSRYIHVLQLGE